MSDRAVYVGSASARYREQLAHVDHHGRSIHRQVVGTRLHEHRVHLGLQLRGDRGRGYDPGVELDGGGRAAVHIDRGHHDIGGPGRLGREHHVHPRDCRRDVAIVGRLGQIRGREASGHVEQIAQGDHRHGAARLPLLARGHVRRLHDGRDDRRVHVRLRHLGDRVRVDRDIELDRGHVGNGLRGSEVEARRLPDHRRGDADRGLSGRQCRNRQHVVGGLASQNGRVVGHEVRETDARGRLRPVEQLVRHEGHHLVRLPTPIGAGALRPRVRERILDVVTQLRLDLRGSWRRRGRWRQGRYPWSRCHSPCRRPPWPPTSASRRRCPG